MFETLLRRLRQMSDTDLHQAGVRPGQERQYLRGVRRDMARSKAAFGALHGVCFCSCRVLLPFLPKTSGRL